MAGPMNPAQVAEFVSTELTSGGRVRIHVTPAAAGCQVPIKSGLAAIIEFGISGVTEGGVIDDWGIKADIWIGGKDGEYQTCRMPWSAILAVTDADNQGLFTDRQHAFKATHKHLAVVQ